MSLRSWTATWWAAQRLGCANPNGSYPDARFVVAENAHASTEILARRVVG